MNRINRKDTSVKNGTVLAKKRLADFFVLSKIWKHRSLMLMVKERILADRSLLALVIIPVLVLVMIDAFLPHQIGSLSSQLSNQQLIQTEVIFVLVLLCVRFLFQFVYRFYSLYSAKHIALKLKEQLTDLTIDSCQGHLNQLDSGDILYRVFTEISNVQKNLIFGSIQFFKNICFVLVTLVNIYLLSLPIFSCLLFIGLILFFYNKILWKQIQQSNRILSEEHGKMTSFFIDVFRGKKDINIFKAEEQYKKAFALRYEKVRNSFWENALLKTKGEVFSEIFATVLIGFVIVTLTLSGNEMATNVTLLTFMGLLINPLKGINTFLTNLNSIYPSIERIDALLAIVNRKTDTHSKHQIKLSSKLGVRIADLSFAYNDGQEHIFKQLQLQFSDGLHLISGPNGIGKTTFAELLSKVLIPEQGKITFCLPEEQMMDQDNIVKLVRQDAHIFDDTIMNNILMANKGLTDQQIVSLINEYEVQSILSPSRLQEHIGELGEKLSGGQRQVISILRGIIANPPVLIFDELSNNLPIDLAERIIRKLAKQRADKATILISHRRLNLNYASQINLAK